MSSATDKQRRLLDELRKLACDINEKEIRSHSVITLNQGRYNRQFRLDMNHDWLNAWHAELERILQAIEATLGPETCHVISIGEFDGEYTVYYAACSNCGYELDDDPLNFCPNCGARWVEQ